MSFKQYEKQDLADFTGRPVASYRDYATKSALPQALMLFKMGTCLASPDDLTDDQKQLVDFAVLEMADSIYLAQPFQAIQANPFSSETIGSYSYSKATQAVRAGLPTGVTWFDMATQQLSVCEGYGASGGIAFGGIEMFENDGVFVEGGSGSQVLRYLSPAEVELSRSWGYDPAPGVQYGGGGHP